MTRGTLFGRIKPFPGVELALLSNVKGIVVDGLMKFAIHPSPAATNPASAEVASVGMSSYRLVIPGTEPAGRKLSVIPEDRMAAMLAGGEFGTG
jgi:hypothetical protein